MKSRFWRQRIGIFKKRSCNTLINSRGFCCELKAIFFGQSLGRLKKCRASSVDVLADLLVNEAKQDITAPVFGGVIASELSERYLMLLVEWWKYGRHIS